MFFFRLECCVSIHFFLKHFFFRRNLNSKRWFVTACLPLNISKNKNCFLFFQKKKLAREVKSETKKFCFKYILFAWIVKLKVFKIQFKIPYSSYYDSLPKNIALNSELFYYLFIF